MSSIGPRNAPPWWFIGCGGVGLIFFVVVGGMLFPVIAAILFPPDVPVPMGAVETAHTNYSYGFDAWEYALAGDVCEAVAFYEAAGGTCDRAPGHCEAGQRRDARVATCSGTVTFSRFAMRWEATLYDYRSRQELAISRETAWTR